MTMHNVSSNSFLVKDDFSEGLLKSELARLTNPTYLDSLNEPYVIRVGYYLRVSTESQAKSDKVSLGEQETQIIELIHQNNWELVAKYSDEGISGKSMEQRSDFQRMIEDAKAGKFDVIIAWTTDRLARNVDEMTALRAELKKYNIQITTVKEPTEVVDPRFFSLKQDDGIKKLMAYVRDWSAEDDNKKRTLRFEVGKTGKARKGKIPVKVPYGYKKYVTYENGDPKNKNEEDIIVEEEAFVIRKIFELYDKQSLGMVKIASHLNQNGTKSPRGKKWGMSTIKYILQNPTYAGFVRWGWRLAGSKESRTRLLQGHQGIIQKGLHKNIIELDRYERVQEKMRIRHKLGGKAVSSHGLLTGILKCGRCGGGTYITRYPSHYAYTKPENERAQYKEVATYFCSNYAHFGSSGCKKRYIIAAHKLEQIVTEKIKELANSQEARDTFTQQMKRNNVTFIKAKVNSLSQALVKIDDKIARLKNAYTNSVISLDEFSQDKKQFDKEKQDILNKIALHEKELVNEERVAQQTEASLYALADFDKSWSSADFSEKKALLQSILDKVVVSDKEISISFRQS